MQNLICLVTVGAHKIGKLCCQRCAHADDLSLVSRMLEQSRMKVTNNHMFPGLVRWQATGFAASELSAA